MKASMVKMWLTVRPEAECAVVKEVRAGLIDGHTGCAEVGVSCGDAVDWATQGLSTTIKTESQTDVTGCVWSSDTLARLKYSFSWCKSHWLLRLFFNAEWTHEITKNVAFWHLVGDCCYCLCIDWFALIQCFSYASECFCFVHLIKTAADRSTHSLSLWNNV